MSDPRGEIENVRALAKARDVRGLIANVRNPAQINGVAAQLVAIRALGRLRETTAVSVLRDLFEDAEADARAEIAIALGKIGGPEARGALVEIVNIAPRGVARQWAVDALARQGDLSALEPLIDYLGADTPHVQLWAAKLLARLGTREALEPLRQREVAEQGIQRLLLRRHRRELERALRRRSA